MVGEVTFINLDGIFSLSTLTTQIALMTGTSGSSHDTYETLRL